MSEIAKKFKERFINLVNEEINNPNIKVLIFKMGEPVSDEIIEKVEEKFGFPLDLAIKEFYKQCNGVIYRAYKIKPEIAAKGEEIGKIGSTDFIDWGEFCNDNNLDWIGEDSTWRNGSIRHVYIRPLEDVLLGEQYLINEDYEEEKNLYLLDAWYYYYPVMLEANEEEKSFKVVMGNDYGACYDDYPKISFEEYLDQFFYSTLSERFIGNYSFQAFNIE